MSFSSGLAATEIVRCAIELSPAAPEGLDRLVDLAAGITAPLTPTETVALVCELANVARCFASLLDDDTRTSALVALDVAIMESRDPRGD